VAVDDREDQAVKKQQRGYRDDLRRGERGAGEPGHGSHGEGHGDREDYSDKRLKGGRAVVLRAC
jgi:hypothetical protein